MSVSVPFHRIAEIPAPATYEVVSGNWWLHGSLENGEVRSWGERHVVTINEATGHFTCEGGYGTFSYCWPSPNRGPESLHAFMYDLEFDYFMGKASKQPHRQFDADRTVDAMRRVVIEQRRAGELTKREAADIWFDIDHEIGGGGTDENEFYHLFARCGASTYGLFCDGGPSIYTIEHPGMRRFWDEIWTPFAREVLKPHWDQHRADRALANAQRTVA